MSPVGLMRRVKLNSRSDVGGEWRSPVAHSVWDAGVAGSNPVSPTTDVLFNKACDDGEWID